MARQFLLRRALLGALGLVLASLPHIAYSQSSDTLFAKGFNLPGVTGTILTMQYDQLRGRVYCGGNFRVHTESGEMHNLAYYDFQDSAWGGMNAAFTPGGGANIDHVYVLQMMGSYRLAVGGDFTDANGNDELDYLAVCELDGGTWRSFADFGDQVDGPVHAVAAMSDGYLIGGQFTSVDGVTSPGLALFRSLEGVWTAPAVTLTRAFAGPVVYDIQFLNSIDFIIGGAFDGAGAVVSKNIIRYHAGYDQWTALANGGLDAYCNVLVRESLVSGSAVVAAGGMFSKTADGALNVSRVARLRVNSAPGDTGSTWEPASTDVLSGAVLDMERFDGGLYAVGDIWVIGEDSIRNVLRLNDVTGEWENIGFGPLASCRALTKYSGVGDSGLFLGGSFHKAGGVVSFGLALCRGPGDFRSFGNGVVGSISAMAADSAGRVIIAGNLSSVGPHETGSLAIWTGADWQTFDEKFDQSILVVKPVGGDSIYVGGNFYTIGGLPPGKLALWDGAAWQSVGGAVFNGPVCDLAISPKDGSLYAVGYFTSPHAYIARYDGSVWHPVTFPAMGLTGLKLIDVGYIAEIDQEIITVGGEFGAILDGQGNLVMAPGMAQGINEYWFSLSSADDNPEFNILSPSVMAASGDGALFASSGYLLWRFSGRWEEPIPDHNVCFTVKALLSERCGLYASGQWGGPYVSGCSGTNLVYWSGAWHDVGTVKEIPSFGQIDSAVATADHLVAAGGKLYVGGDFDLAGNQPSRNFAVWNGIAEGFYEGTAAISSPVAGDTLRYGDVHNIKFSMEGMERLVMEYSLDSGLTWDILYHRADTSHPLLWIVPDTNAEFCQLRASNAHNACNYTYGEVFTITSEEGLVVHRITRPRGYEYHEPFLEQYHNFSFPNDSASVWPEEHFYSIDYSQWPWPVNPTNNPEANPDWGLFVDAFGERRCYTRLKTPKIVNPEMFTMWRVIRRNPWSGSCYGFTVAAVLQFYGMSLNESLFIPDDEYLYELGLNEFWRKVVNKFWIYQFGGKHNWYDILHAGIPASRTLDTLIKGMSGVPDEYPRGLSFARKVLQPPDSGKTTPALAAADDSTKERIGHSVLPYMIRNWPDTPGVWYAYIYDNNRPNELDDYFRFDVINETYSASHIGWAGTDTADGARPTLPITEFVGLAGDPRFEYKVAMSPNAEDGLAAIYTSSQEDVMIHDGEGRRLGEDSVDYYEEIPGAMMLTVTNPDWPWRHPLGYILPIGDYEIRISGYADTTTELLWQRDSLTYHIRRSAPSASDTDALRIDSGLTYINPDVAAKSPSLTVIAGDTIKGSYYVQLDSLVFQPNDSVTVRMGDSARVHLTNRGEPKAYSLILWRTHDKGQQFTQSLTRMEINGGANHLIVPNWEQLEGSATQVLIDNDGDGIYEDTAAMDIAVGVDDDPPSGLPAHIHLGQNYPNPFNLSTTIEFTLAAGARTTLTVYNVLGQHVRTLLARDLAAGEHSITWNGTNDAGRTVSTGVYFYRLTTDAESRIRKMLLLK